MDIESKSQNREEGLNYIGQAYLDVKNGKAGAVMIVVRDGEMTVQTAGISNADAVIAVAQANSILVSEMRDALVGLMENIDEPDEE